MEQISSNTTSTTSSSRVISRRNAVPIVEKSPERMGTLRTIFGQKCTTLQDFAYTVSYTSSGVILPEPRRSAPGAWTQTQIYTWLASVFIVPILRNDQWHQAFKFAGVSLKIHRRNCWSVQNGRLCLAACIEKLKDSILNVLFLHWYLSWLPFSALSTISYETAINNRKILTYSEIWICVFRFPHSADSVKSIKFWASSRSHSVPDFVRFW